MPIPDELETEVQRLLVDRLSDVFDLDYTEIQEDDDGTPYSYDNLLIGVIPKREATKEQIRSALARARVLLAPLFTAALGRWRWVVIASRSRGGEILDGESSSCDFPNV